MAILAKVLAGLRHPGAGDGDNRPGMQPVIASLVEVYERSGRPDKTAAWRQHLQAG